MENFADVADRDIGYCLLVIAYETAVPGRKWLSTGYCTVVKSKLSVDLVRF